MTADRWARARALFDGAVALDAADRDAFLDAGCGGDVDLRAEVASLLAASDRAGDFIERPMFEAAAELVAGHSVDGGGDGGNDDNDGDDGVDRGASLEGRAIGPYLVRHEIGRGGMGVVYLADDTRLARRVALKALPPAIAGDHARRARLRNEARAAAAISHPNIATVYALEEIRDALYLITEHVPGQTLRALIASASPSSLLGPGPGAAPLPIEDVVDVAMQLAQALAASHALGVAHLDLKPENVVRTPSGVVKVLDFGLARVESQDAPGGEAFGTPGYMAPEQIRREAGAGDGAIDARADQFAWGVIVHEMLTGAHPFGSGPPASMLARTLDVDPPPLSAIRRTGLPAFDLAVAKALRKAPSDRYASTRDLVRDLERSLTTAAPTAVTPTGRIAPTTAASSITSPGWWTFHQAAVAAVVVLTMAPVWVARTWLPRPWGTASLLIILACAAASATLRLHLYFTARVHADALADERRRTHVWIQSCEVVWTAALLAMAGTVATDHQAMAVVLVTIAIATALASFVIEPATARAAFDRSSA